MIDAWRIFKQPELPTDRRRIRSPGREQKEPGVARCHQNTALVAIRLAQPEQFVERYRTLQIGNAHTDVVESLHHVRWLRLFRRPVAKTSESSPRQQKPLSPFRPQNRTDHTSDEANSVG